MTDPVLRFDVQGAVAVVTMNRPARKNAISLEMVHLLAAAWDEVENDDQIRVAVLTGAGDTYCVGGDLAEGWMVNPGGDASPAEVEARSRTISRGLLLSRGLSKPLIAAVNGACLGGGCEMLQQTDIRVAEAHATFGLPEARVGLIAGAGSTVRLKRQIPYTKAMEMILTGDPLTAQEAYDFGLVGRVVPTGDGLATALGLAERVAANGPLAVQRAKAAAVESGWLDEEAAREIERRHVRVVVTSEDAREGIRAFGEKRPPQFNGR
ncbi:enoyl-CoA hydratase-related protein [Nocardioides dongkuii]|uniref:enoyl-CoA hydratase-related protein n=1 Tax=Nocardioides dongkuii TaxID=2760089 RepID=UPI0029D41468|nr:enoyl-CoA hydratase-related protein [Nocardioides dongkuii]